MNTKSDTHTDERNTKRRVRHYLFTLNNSTKEEDKYIASLATDERIDMIACQEEIGEGGTRHLQFAISWKNARPFSAVKKEFPRAHIEQAKNKWAAMNYCQKKDTATGNMVIKKGLTNAIIATERKYDISKRLMYKLSDEYDKIFISKKSSNCWKIIRGLKFKFNKICLLSGDDKMKKTALYNWLRSNKCNPDLIITTGILSNDIMDTIVEGVAVNERTGEYLIFDSRKVLALVRYGDEEL